MRKVFITKSNFIFSLSFLSAIFFYSCAPTRLIRPLNKGEKVISANLGGPLFDFHNLTIPIPLTSLMYAQGLTDNTSVFGSIHTTSLLFGVAQTDIGICQKVYYNDSLRLGVSANPALNIAQEFWPATSGGFKCWPQLDLNAYWEFNPHKSFVYAGIENWFELAQQRPDGETQTTHWIYCPQIGYTSVRHKWNYDFELKFIAPNLDNLPNVVDYFGIGGNGALAVYFTVTYKLF